MAERQQDADYEPPLASSPYFGGEALCHKGKMTAHPNHQGSKKAAKLHTPTKLYESTTYLIDTPLNKRRKSFEGHSFCLAKASSLQVND
jgi:hypothetical protein